MSEQSIRVMPQNREAGSLTPAFMTPTTQDVSTEGLPIFTNPVQGNVDTTSTHSGDVGGAA